MLLKAIKGLFVAAVAVLSFVSTSVYLDSQTFATPREYVHLITDGNGAGSVVVIMPNFALTAAHVLKDKENLTVNDLPVVASWSDASKDLGLIHVPGLACPCAPLGTNLLPDDKLITIGYPLGKFQYVTEGRMQGHDAVEPKTWVSSPIIFGNSGGGVFAFQAFSWKLTGIAVEIAGIPQGWQGAYYIAHMSRMVTISQIRDFLQRIHNGDVERKQAD